ncbi:hypothetical protein [Bradyrhizobium centrosematis]|uniref:hypothetical protein n=1 Tax=Bradyrhizobium centrosematis TaxID=1300039 RepID=UPI00388DC984
MSISAIASTGAAVTASASTATTASSAASSTTAASATSETSSSQSAGGSGGSGGSSAKTIVSEVSITIDGVTTTTITYSDGTTEVQTSASEQGSQSGQTYNAQGALQANGQAASGTGTVSE